MLCDRPDVADIPVINGNEPRNSQLRQINERYCVEVLLIWFQCLFKQSDTNSMQFCNNFLSFVENIQPRVV